jgi:Putative prokaryotic signal transducing protein
MKIVFLTANWVEAQLIVGLLEGNGLKAILLDSELSRMDPFYTAAIGNIKVVVPEPQFEKAMAVLREYRAKEGLDPNHGSRSPIG